MPLKIKFLGGASTVTGSKFLLEGDNSKFLVDCGLFQGSKRTKNWASFPVKPSEIDFILLTHAHIDHSGYLPCLVKQGFKGPIFTTHATLSLAEVLLPDCAHLMAEEAKYANTKNFSKHSPARALFDLKDVTKTLNLFRTVGYGEEISVAKDIFVSFIDAGHILGSASILIEDKRKGISIGFSGDLGRSSDPILRKPKTFKKLNYLVIESTYGDRNHPDRDPSDELAQIINRTTERGGSVIIPAFAVGRTQNLLFYLAGLLREKKIPSIPIFLNSPMASNASKIYCEYPEDHSLSEKQCKEMFSIARFVKGSDESISLNKKPSPMIIISASGMATGGRVLYHLKRFLPDEKSTVIFSGFQAPGTRGDKLVKSAKTIKIHGTEWPVKAEVIQLESMSAHADQKELLSWLKEDPIDPKKIFVVHGEQEASKTLAKKIKEDFSWETVVPNIGESFEL